MQTCPFYIQTCSAQLFNELKVSSKNETFKSFYNSKISLGADGNVRHAVKIEKAIQFPCNMIIQFGKFNLFP